MIKIIIKITLSILILLSALFVKAQDFQGKAVYQTKINMGDDVKKRLDSSKISEDRKAFFMKMIKKRMEKVYELDFSKTASIYKEQKSLAAPSENARFNRSANDLLFKDIKNKTFTNKKETFGKVFLIKDDLKTYDWKLEKETKMIGNYLCLKATAETELDKRTRFMRFTKKESEKKKDSSKVEEPKMLKITAWYTPEIPVNNGPKNYHGLPGLILEVNAGKTQILCTKIVLNPKESVEIVASKKGTEITQKEYDKVMKKKMEEMKDRFKSKRKKGSKSSRHIRF